MLSAGTPTQDKKRKQSFLVTAKSREQLIQETDQLHQSRQRRTKIIATIGDQSLNYEKVKEIVQAGVTCLNLNSAYTRSRSSIKELAQIRDRLEQELDIYIPLNLILKGRQIRIGSLRHSEVLLKAGNVVRLISDEKVLGDENILAIDDEGFFDQVRIGEKLVVDYGQVVLGVKSREDSDHSFKELMEQYPNLYTSVSSFRKVKGEDNDSESKQSMSECDTYNKRSSSRKNSIRSATRPGAFDEIAEDGNTQDERSLRKQKYAEVLLRQKEAKKNKKYKVLVCVVQADCILKPLRPVFILNESNWNTQDFVKPMSKKYSCQNLTAQLGQGRIMEQPGEDNDDSDEEGEESQITAADIVCIKNARKYGFDAITISNVHKASEVRDVRNVLGDDNQLKVLVRITTKEAVDNFQEIAQESDGVIIARAYILVQCAIETVVYQELDMIRKGIQLLKPVIVSSQVLESMITSLFPNFSEMGDIATLVNEDIDAIVLTGETAYGKYPAQSIATLDRVCRFVEANQIQKRIQRFALRVNQIGKKHLVANAIASATIDAAYRISAKAIVVFTSTGSTALKISKLKPPCHIISVTTDKRIARSLQLLGGILSLCFGTFVGTEALQERVTQMALEKRILKRGDYVIFLSGSIENLSGVQERQAWSKWGEVKDLKRGHLKDGDKFDEAELRIQTANNQEEYNFVIPEPKTKFVVDFTAPEEKPQSQQQQQQARQIGGAIQFSSEAQSSQQWLLIISNLSQFEFASTFQEIIQIKDDFRFWLAKQLGQGESRNTYFVNFLQNKRKAKIQSLDKQAQIYPLIHKVMLKFQDRDAAERAHVKLDGKNYEGSVLNLELQEQRAR